MWGNTYSITQISWIKMFILKKEKEEKRLFKQEQSLRRAICGVIRAKVCMWHVWAC